MKPIVLFSTLLLALQLATPTRAELRLLAAELPREIVLKLQAEIGRALKNPDIRAKLVAQGADPVGSTPEEFSAYMRAETAKWARVVKASGAKAD